MAHPGGKPRTTSPPPDECTELGEELLKWVKEENQEDPRLRFAQFYSEKMMMPRKQWKAIIQIPEFLPYYEQAQSILAKRCINGTMEKSFGQRFIRLYERDLTEHEDATAKFNAELRKLDEAKTQDIKINIIDYTDKKIDAALQ